MNERFFRSRRTLGLPSNIEFGGPGVYTAQATRAACQRAFFSLDPESNQTLLVFLQEESKYEEGGKTPKYIHAHLYALTLSHYHYPLRWP